MATSGNGSFCPSQFDQSDRHYHSQYGAVLNGLANTYAGGAAAPAGRGRESGPDVGPPASAIVFTCTLVLLAHIYIVFSSQAMIHERIIMPGSSHSTARPLGPRPLALGLSFRGVLKMAVSLIFIVLHLILLQSVKPELIQVQAIIRHGNRAPNAIMYTICPSVFPDEQTIISKFGALPQVSFVVESRVYQFTC